ncbi:MAG: M48 family metallopeptidase [Candidatus Electryoneaceae bacterium]|nr:M48 family metallopeptidase [Candidatus Electryoneaceae bacterium]
MSKRTISTSLSLVILFFMITSCSTVPITGRRQINMIPGSQLNAMSFQEYSTFMSSHQLSNNVEQNRMVQRVGRKIQHAVEQYLAQNNMSNHLQGYRWEFKLVKSPEANAWCMPGGKVAIYTGILPITQTEAGLAVVMGHEIAHAIANHGNERMSQGLITMIGGIALTEALKTKKQETRNLFMAAYGIGTQVGILLPFSRLHESEADRVGLIFMAMAGYNPNEAVSFWQRMAARSGGNAPPEFLSTHPSNQTRIREMQKALPEAMEYYRR